MTEVAHKQLVRFIFKQRNGAYNIINAWDRHPPDGVAYYDHVCKFADVFHAIKKEHILPKQIRVGLSMFSTLKYDLPGVRMLGSSLYYMSHEFVLDDNIGLLDVMWGEE